MSGDTQTSLGQDNQQLHEKLKWLMFFRVAVATIILATVVLVEFRGGGIQPSPVVSTFYLLAGLVFFLSILYVPVFKYVKKPTSLARSQSIVDIIIITFVVYVSGGYDSPLAFLYILTIISSTIVSYGISVFWAASFSAIFYGVLINAQYFRLIPSMTEVVTGDIQPIPDNILYTAAANISAFFLVALLSSYLAIQTKKVEKELIEKKIDYDALVTLNNDIVKNISSGLMTINPEGEITSFNSAAENISGISLEKIYGQKVENLFPDFGRTLKESNHSDSDASSRWEIPFNRPDGKEYYLAFSISPLMDALGEKSGDIVFFQDLTALKLMENELKKNDRLAAVGRFAANVAHEIRNPLASISGSVEILKKDMSDKTEVYNERLMNIIIREIDRLNMLITEFLNYASPSLPKRDKVDINYLIDETIEVILNSEKDMKDIKIKKENGEIPVINADGAQIKQVLWNLINNAIDSIDKAGEIVIGTSSFSDGAKENVAVIVSDNGCGIEENERDKIFDPFHTSKARGSGLGLSIAHSIVSAHGGTLSLESKPREGTVFKVILPV